MSADHKPERVLVTGATGFVGQAFCQWLLDLGHVVTALGRRAIFPLPLSHPNFTYHSIDFQKKDEQNETLLASLMQGVDVVVHLAARVHHLKETGMQQLSAYQEINVDVTQRVAKAAVNASVKRFVYLSTIKVLGEKTIGSPFRAEDHPRPQDAYSVSKLQAEKILQEECRRSGMEWVIIRPPLIYGLAAKGNFKRLLNLSKTCLPLPFRTIRNRRSLVSLENLCSFIACCVSHPHARGEVFLVSDNHDLSTAELIKTMRKIQSKWAKLFPFPIGLLKLLGCLAGRRREVDRLIDSLQLNIEKSMRLLEWQPPMTPEKSLSGLLDQKRAACEHAQAAPILP